MQELMQLQLQVLEMRTVGPTVAPDLLMLPLSAIVSAPKW